MEDLVMLKQKPVRMSIEMHEGLRRRLKDRAAQEDRTVHDIVSTLVRDYLSSEPLALAEEVGDES